MTSMRALRIEAHGGPEVLQWQSLPVPVPRAGEALVRVDAAGINFMDVHTHQGKYSASQTYPVRVPCTLGMEGAGAVVALGPQHGDFAIGDRVAWCLSWGAFATYACVPVRQLVRVPPGLALRDAAGILFHGLTAHYLVHDVARLALGQSILVHAGGGNIANLLIQMAVAQGVQVYATASSAPKAARAQAAGAKVFDYKDFAAQVRQETQGTGVDVCFDSVGHPTLRESLKAARRRGLVVNYGTVGGAVSDLDPIELGEAGSLFLTRPRLADHIAQPEDLSARAELVFNHVLSQTLRPSLIHVSGWDHIIPAMHALETRRSVEKIVVQLPADA
jgi:NADPH2:quinone reductase